MDPQIIVPTRQLPEGYAMHYSVNLRNNKKAVLWMQVLTVPALFLFGWLFTWLGLKLRYDAFLNLKNMDGLSLSILVVVASFLVIFIHELIHGLFIWIFTKESAKYGLSWFYAYAGAPDWYFDRKHYAVIALSPLVLITLTGLLLMLLVPSPAVIVLLGCIIYNAAGAVGDLWVVWKTLLEPAHLLIRDMGDGFEFYRRG